MRVVFNCCPKPMQFKRQDGLTLFKGDRPEVAFETKVVGDTFVKSVPQCEGGACAAPSK